MYSEFAGATPLFVMQCDTVQSAPIVPKAACQG